MKFTLVVVAVVCVVLAVEATPKEETRFKRAAALENCPPNSTPEQCLAYATEQSQKLNYCHRFIADDTTIQWHSCGKVSCGDNARLTKEDLSKPYPACCAGCELIDPSKPAVYSGVL